MSLPFRNSAAFGKRIEFYVVGLMLKAGFDVYEHVKPQYERFVAGGRELSSDSRR